MPVAAAAVLSVAAVAAAAVAANNRRRMHASRHSCCPDHCSLENSQKTNQLALPGGPPTLLLLPFLDFWEARTDECVQAWQVAVPPPAVAAVVPPPPPPCASSPPFF
jgi:hypothetical protein